LFHPKSLHIQKPKAQKEKPLILLQQVFYTQG
jgi:hypothetical protein